MGGIGRLNDAVGGVTVNVLDDYPFTNVPRGAWNMYPGQNVTLTGQQARLYIQCRRGDATGNEGPHAAAEAVYAGPDRPGQGPGWPPVLPASCRCTTPSATMC